MYPFDYYKNQKKRNGKIFSKWTKIKMSKMKICQHNVQNGV